MVWHKSKRILLGVSGGIAAYKSPQLARRLIERGCEVRVAMTRAACEFITPLTMQAVSGHPVHLHFLDAEAESGMGHIELARWAEQVIVAPASADFLARLAHGRAGDLLAAVALATEAEVAVAPAMNRLMWEHAATRENLKTLAARGVRVIGPGAGDQACGETGPGRMSEPEEIAVEIAGDARPLLLDGVDTLIT
ncbi:MAG: bifunctional 4'-phosphopantothenoylcysteine decarboxylase/phosphopantothenoylcysteine synthetase, partial [Gammaproteobacteria bacterium]|nr:bifunctional 4'-phosphopantothenoylcysteine decarboxylase/phosphopantothenoylcysteine synthetase [Gammaproteobacteria bacterium]